MSVSAARPHDLSGAAHSHGFADPGRAGRGRAMGAVTLLTLATMAAELLAGWWSGSLALTADGWHMGTHALAIGGAWLAYRLAARVEAHAAAGHAAGARYTFGGWKIEVLAAYTSGLALLVVALWLVVDSVARLVNPVPVAFAPALAVACVGLAVNLASAAMLMRGHRRGSAAGASASRGAAEHGHLHSARPRGDAEGDAHPHHHGHAHDQERGHAHDHAPDHAHDHARGHAHDHAHGHGHGHDHNFNAAYLHVLADALTSVLAIAALGGGVLFGWLWLDPAVALVGALVIVQWSRGVLGGSARALVDATADPKLAARIREAIESDGDATVADLHVWQVGGRAWCAALAVVADDPRPPAHYRQQLARIGALRHVTVEVHRCPGCDAAPPAAAASSKPA
ncbi:MAG: cation transporter [Rubrivivax sp.]|nr:cation transporter [Rubrivivax sp.]